MSSVVVQLMAGVLVASVVALVVVATHRLLLLSQSAMVPRWAPVASGVAEDSGVGLTEEEAASEVAVVVLAAAASTAVEEADVSAAIVMVHPTEHLLALDLVADSVVDATEVVDSTTVAHAATLTLSLCPREVVIGEEIEVETVTAAIAAVIVIVIGTMTTLDLVGMLDRSDLTMAVGMTSRGRDAATKWLYLLMDFTARRQKFNHTQHFALAVAAQNLHSACTITTRPKTNGESDYLLRVSTGSHRQLRVHHY
jgi:hypothetical protein